MKKIKRPADVASNAVHVMRIATGEIEETSSNIARANAGRLGGKARASDMTAAQRKAAAQKAAAARWKKS